MPPALIGFTCQREKRADDALLNTSTSGGNGGHAIPRTWRLQLTIGMPLFILYTVVSADCSPWHAMKKRRRQVHMKNVVDSFLLEKNVVDGPLA